MLAKLSLLAIILPLVHALTLSTPTNVTAGASVTVTWTTVPADPPTFDLYISNPPLFNQDLAVLATVQTSAGSATFTVPIIPSNSGYTIKAVDISNRGNTYASSGPFSVKGPFSTMVVTTTSATGSTPLAATPTASLSPFTNTNAFPPGPSVVSESTPTPTSTGSSSGAVSVKFASGYLAAILVSGGAVLAYL